jgi:hypothetical protein
MASYPGPKVHRTGNRRKLGRGQVIPMPGATLTITAASADVMQIVSSVPVVWQAAILATVATLTRVSQAVVSSTEVQITFSGAVAGHAYTVPAGAGTTFLGGQTLPASGTF